MDQPTPTPPPVPPSLPPAVPTPPIPTQAGVPLPPTAFRVPPAVEAPRKSSSGTVGTVITCGLLILAVMGFVGKAVVKRLAKARGADRAATALNSGTMNPYELMSSDYSRNPSKFRTGVAKGAARGLKKNVPQATFTLDEAAEVDDLGKALRTVIGYRGEVPGPDGEISLQGQLRQYVHPHGMVMVETACFSRYSMCLELDDLATSTDARVMAHLGSQNVRGMLPPDAECEASGAAGFGRELMVCKVGEEVVITFQNLSLEQTRREFQRIATDPSLKDLEGQ
jgi:hypothetical protein